MLLAKEEMNFIALFISSPHTEITGKLLWRFTHDRRKDIKVWWQSHFEKLTLANLSDLALRGAVVLSPQTAAAKQCLDERFFRKWKEFAVMFLFFLSSFLQWHHFSFPNQFLITIYFCYLPRNAIAYLSSFVTGKWRGKKQFNLGFSPDWVYKFY